MKRRFNVVLRGLLLASLATLGCGSDDSSSGGDGAGSGAAGGSGGSGNTGGSLGSSGKGGGAGKSGSGGSSGDTGAAGEAPCTGTDCVECRAEGESCEPGGSDCCDGTCIESDSGTFSGCRALCQDAADCDSGCCQPFSNADGGFCVDAAYCSCVEQGGACGPSVESPCCDGSTCAITDGPYLCQQICTTSDECPETCCVPLGDTGVDICAPAEFCL